MLLLCDYKLTDEDYKCPKLSSDDMELDNLYNKILDNESGELSSLEKISKEGTLHLCKLGFIKRSVDAQNHESYSLTTFGRKQILLSKRMSQMSNDLEVIVDFLV